LRYPWLLTLAIAGTIGLQATALIGPLYLRTFINTLANSTPETILLTPILTILGVYTLIAIGNLLTRRSQMLAVMLIEARVMADLSDSAFSYLIRHGHDFFISNFAGTLTRRVTRYARSYEQVLDSAILNFLPTLLFAAGSITILYLRNMWLGLMLLAWVLLFITIQVTLTRWRHPLRVARAAEDSRMTGALSDAIGNHSAVSVFATEAYEDSYIASIVKVWRAITMRSWFAEVWIQAIQHALAIVVEIGLLYGAVVLWHRGELTLGDFVLIQVYVLGLVDQVWNIGNVLRRLYDSFADASEMVDILETPHAIQDAPNAPGLVLTRGEIELKDVLFYFTKDRPVLDHFSLLIAGGEKVALVGPSGAGKSTITKLLLRLYDVQGGVVQIDGQDVREVTQQSLRSLISFVPQEPALFHRTLRENIAYGKQDASLDEVIEAAKKAHCHEFISRLPEGYQTYVGERGVKLSGGERQRVAIARAILKNAPILILDEATSSLDSESEALIQDALAKLMEGKTVIAIAHRLSTIMKMDRIVVMENGKVLLTGTHDELIAEESNLYKKLWDIQAGGFIQSDT
jgi:ATP-binding cassette subfamily B protein